MKIPATPPTLPEIIEARRRNPESFEALVRILTRPVGPAPDGRYRHWDKLRRLTPPAGMTPEDWWAAIKFARAPLRRDLPIRDKRGRPFHYALVDPVLEFLHAIDRDASGQLATLEPIANPQLRDRYVQSSLIEEAITSSQLEGAATTREIAKDMLRSGRSPVDRSERMILNNYQAIRAISEIRREPLTQQLIERIHGDITEKTLPPGMTPPYFRTAGDGVAVYDRADGALLHSPPHADEILPRIAAMCEFANRKETGIFLHPVIKAIVLHFWLAYDHPFIDGNGRTARALFYWYMLSQDFWLFEFVSISHIFRKAPSQYARAFLYSETDENDLTYFLLYHLDVISRAIEELKSYLARKTADVRETERLLRSTVSLNHRQIALLSHALRHPGTRYTIESHRRSHDVTYQTARTDLLSLQKRRLLDVTRAGRAFVFAAPKDLDQRLQKLRQ